MKQFSKSFTFLQNIITKWKDILEVIEIIQTMRKSVQSCNCFSEEFLLKGLINIKTSNLSLFFLRPTFLVLIETENESPLSRLLHQLQNKSRTFDLGMSTSMDCPFWKCTWQSSGIEYFQQKQKKLVTCLLTF